MPASTRASLTNRPRTGWWISLLTSARSWSAGCQMLDVRYPTSLDTELNMLLGAAQDNQRQNDASVTVGALPGSRRAERAKTSY